MTKRGMGADASPWKLGDASRDSCFRAAYSSGKDFSRMSCSALVTFSSRPACSTCAHEGLVSTYSNSHSSLAQRPASVMVHSSLACKLVC